MWSWLLSSPGTGSALTAAVLLSVAGAAMRAAAAHFGVRPPIRPDA